MVSDPGDMRVMLTPPDIWGSTGYVTTDTEDNTDNMYKVRPECVLCHALILSQVRQVGSVDDMQWGVAGGSGEDKETVNQNIILINRQRQVNSEHFLQKALLICSVRV